MHAACPVIRGPQETERRDQPWGPFSDDAIRGRSRSVGSLLLRCIIKSSHGLASRTLWGDRRYARALTERERHSWSLPWRLPLTWHHVAIQFHSWPPPRIHPSWLSSTAATIFLATATCTNRMDLDDWLSIMLGFSPSISSCL